MQKHLFIFISILAVLAMHSCRTPIIERYPEPAPYPDQVDNIGYDDPGQELFERKCAACHSLRNTRVGPTLECISDKRSDEWMASFIRNSRALIESGDADAVSVFQEFNEIPMPRFPNLSDYEMNLLLNYLREDCESVHIEREGDDYLSSFTVPEVFARKCATCHQLNKDSTAPKFKGILDRSPGEQWFANYVRQEDSLLRINDPYTLEIDNWNESFSFTHHFEDVTDEEMQELIDYTK
jgi:cytochrome c2